MISTGAISHNALTHVCTTDANPYGPPLQVEKSCGLKWVKRQLCGDSDFKLREGRIRSRGVARA